MPLISLIPLNPRQTQQSLSRLLVLSTRAVDRAKGERGPWSASLGDLTEVGV
jgi:hypothetical protein